MDKKPGGSYTKDPETGELTLVEQTKQQKITRLESPKKPSTKRGSKKSKAEK